MNPARARILITGASGGIGSALAERLGAEGADLLLHGYRNLEGLAGELSGEKVQADLSSAAGIEKVAEAARAFDINVLINNSGINQFSAFEEAEIEQIVSLNITGPMLLTQKLLPHLRSQKSATIVNVGSTFGQIGFPGYVAYCATKHAIKGFSEALRRELADTGIRVMHVSPRATRTGMNPDAVNDLNTALGTGCDEPAFLADRIVHALVNGKDRLQMGGPEKAQVKLNSLFPGIVDAALLKQLPTIRAHYSRLT